MNIRQNKDGIEQAQQAGMPNRVVCSGSLLFCGLAVLLSTSTPSVLADSQIYQYVDPKGEVSLSNVLIQPPRLRCKPRQDTMRLFRTLKSSRRWPMLRADIMCSRLSYSP